MFNLFKPNQKIYKKCRVEKKFTLQHYGDSMLDTIANRDAVVGEVLTLEINEKGDLLKIHDERGTKWGEHRLITTKEYILNNCSSIPENNNEN